MTTTQIEILMRDIYRVQGYAKPNKDAKENERNHCKEKESSKLDIQAE